MGKTKKCLTVPRDNPSSVENNKPFAATAAGVNEVNLYNQGTNPNPNSSNYLQALLAINPHSKTPKQRYDLEQLNPPLPTMRMNAMNAVVNGPEDLQHIYGNKRQQIVTDFKGVHVLGVRIASCA